MTHIPIYVKNMKKKKKIEQYLEKICETIALLRNSSIFARLYAKNAYLMINQLKMTSESTRLSLEIFTIYTLRNSVPVMSVLHIGSFTRFARESWRNLGNER